MSEPLLLRSAVALPSSLAQGPFTPALAREAGLDRHHLRGLVLDEALCHPMRGVYYSRHLDDDVSLRVQCLKLIVPRNYVVTDRTAGWLWGAEMILAPGSHRQPERVSAYAPPGSRMRNALTMSGERALDPRDIGLVDGLAVTTPLRTACDLGRLLHRDRAIGAMDCLLRLGFFTHEELRLEVGRFRGYRGVRQLRWLTPLVDAGAQSPQESLLRLRWHEAGLPWPECQVEVPGPDGGSFYIDVGLHASRFGAEYDGAAFHGPGARPHDDDRRRWITEHEQWTLVVLRSQNVQGRQQDVIERLQAAFRGSARR